MSDITQLGIMVVIVIFGSLGTYFLGKILDELQFISSFIKGEKK